MTACRKAAAVLLLAGLAGAGSSSGWAVAAVIAVPGAHATIQAALAVATPGDTIEVDSGTYKEKLVFPSNGSPEAPITLRAKPGASARPVLDGSGVPGANMILLDSKSHVAIVGFEIRNHLGVNDGSGIRVTGSGSGITIRDNVIHEIRGRHAMGITVYGTGTTSISDLLIDGNEIYDCDAATSEALTLNGNVVDFEVTNNTVSDVNNIGIAMIGGETDIQPNVALVARDGVVRGNTVVRARSSYGGGFAAGIYVDGGRDIVIENNEVTECDLGIEVGAENKGLVTRGVIVRNNLVYRNDKAGIGVGGYASSVGRADGNVFRGNTLYDNNRMTAGEGEVWVQFAANNLVANNLIVAGGGADKNVFIASFAGSADNIFDYNLYYTLGGEPGTFQLNGTVYDGLAAWQGGAAQDANSIFAVPQLVNPWAGDFHLRPSSPAVGAGDPAYVPEPGESDIDGATRRVGTAVDMGADELACGDGVLDAGEQCDDGNVQSGDGCDENCTYTVCGNGIVTPVTGEQCDDGNLTDGDCCSGSCEFAVTGSACDDGAVCSVVDVCDGGGKCVGSTEADPSCASTPSSKATLKLRSGARALATWRWRGGDTGDLAELGDPVSEVTIAFCVYAQTPGAHEIVLAAATRPGPDWSAIRAGGFRYKRNDGVSHGLTALQLRPGEAGRAKLKVKGKGPRLPLADLGFGAGSAIEAQLRSSRGGCYGSLFVPPYAKDDGANFSDRTD